MSVLRDGHTHAITVAGGTHWRRSGYYGRPRCEVCGKLSPTVEHLHECAEQAATMNHTRSMGRTRSQSAHITPIGTYNRDCPQCGANCRAASKAKDARYYACACGKRFKVTHEGEVADVNPAKSHVRNPPQEAKAAAGACASHNAIGAPY